MKQSDVKLKQLKSLIKKNCSKTDEMLQGFDIDEAVKLFDRFTRGKGNLLNSKLVSFFIKIHWVLFFITSEKITQTCMT